MTLVLLFVAARLAVVLFGAPLAFAPAIRRLGIPARIAAAYAAGSVMLTVWALVLSWIRVRWTIAGIAVPLIALAVVLVAVERRASARRGILRAESPRLHWGWLMIAAAWAHLVLSIAGTRMTSPDYLYFWGAKAARFLDARAIDAALLRQPYMIHLHITYPPLVAVQYAWDGLVIGRMVWRLELFHTALWLIAGSVLIQALLALRMGRERATLVTAFWTAALALALQTSLSAGNGEGPLLFFVSVGAVAVLAGNGAMMIPGAIALAGCVLAKTEGTILWLLILAVAAIMRRRSLRELAPVAIVPAAAIGLWMAFEAAHGLPITDPTRETALALSLRQLPLILDAMGANLNAGAYWISWAVPLVVFAASFRAWRNGVFFIAVSAAMLGFYLFYYLHVAGDVVRMIEWTLPRVSQPSLSLLIIGAGLASGGAHNGESE